MALPVSCAPAAQLSTRARGCQLRPRYTIIHCPVTHPCEPSQAQARARAHARAASLPRPSHLPYAPTPKKLILLRHCAPQPGTSASMRPRMMPPTAMMKGVSQV